MSGRSQLRSSSRNVNLVLVVLVGGLFTVICACIAIMAVINRFSDGKEQATSTAPSALTVAYSPEKELVFTTLVDQFNAQAFKTSDGQTLRIEVVKLDPDAMVNAVLDGSATFQEMTPDSSVWLGQLDQEWSEKTASDAPATGETVRYAVSPVVIA